ncbi:MAG: YeeE/YedE family protein [Ignavibacteriales bacterium]|nr:YeeE/YedE family protein [Ignavibacteriales bacterium]
MKNLMLLSNSFILIGLIIGGYTASKISGTFSPENIPAVWEKYHGKSLVKRYVFVLIGSVLLGYGAALAGGCTTGNILQGWAHLSLGSIVAGAFRFLLQELSLQKFSILNLEAMMTSN